jgi:tetratricopeptide (TPR) repeat protein
LSLIIFPTPDRFSINHLFPVSGSLWDPISTVLSIVGLLVMFLLSVSQIRRRPFLALAILFFLVNHVIESSFIGLELIYEHRNYLPTFFLFTPLAVIIYKSLTVYLQKSRLIFSSLITLSISVILILGMSAHLRNSDWKSEKTIWESALKRYPDSTRAWHNLAYGHYGRNGDYQMALKLYSKALSLDWSTNSAVYRKGITYNNIAGIYYAFGMDEKAIEVWDKAIETYPSYTQAILGQTQALISLGKWDDATISLDRIPEEKQTAKSINMKAFILYKQEKYLDAIRSVRKALTLSPSNMESLTYLGAIYFKLASYPKSRFFLRLAYAKHQDLSVLLLLLENSIFLDDKSAIDKYTKIAADSKNQEKVHSILRLSTKNEKISLSMERIIPLLSAETNKNAKDWIQSVEELMDYQK